MGNSPAGRAFANGVFWAIAWSAVVLVSSGVMAVVGLPVHPKRALFLAFRFAIWGFLAGAAFSVLIGVLAQWPRAAVLNTAGFAIVGAIFTAAFLPLTMQLFNVISGDGLVPWRHVLDDSLWGLPFGGVAAAASLWLDRHAWVGA